MSTINDVRDAVVGYKSKAIADTVQAALDEKAAPNDILDAMISAMDIVGDKFGKGEIFVPEMLMAAKTMNKGVEVLKPHMAADGTASIGKCIIGTVAGDLHDIGKNLVATMIEAAGFEVIDIGVDASVEKFEETINANPDCNVVACSALLTTMLPSMRNTVEKLKAFRAETGKTFKILVGGGCMSQEFADEMGADGFGKDAGSGGQAAKQLVK